MKLAVRSRGKQSATVHFESGKWNSTRTAKLSLGLNVTKVLRGWSQRWSVASAFDFSRQSRGDETTLTCGWLEQSPYALITLKIMPKQLSTSMLWCCGNSNKLLLRGWDHCHAPIAWLLSEISEDTMAKLRVKFDLAHFIATENLHSASIRPCVN